jgi:hypothetical protein
MRERLWRMWQIVAVRRSRPENAALFDIAQVFWPISEAIFCEFV